MNPRDRFHETMRYGLPDRVPLWEEGLRDDVLERWHGEGLGEGEALAERFHYDRREQIAIDLEPRIQPEGGLRDDETLSAWREGLDPYGEGRLPADWSERVDAWKHRDHVLELMIHRGLFRTMEVMGWDSFEPVLYLLADRPDFVRQIMDSYAEFAAVLAERVLSEVEIDFVYFSEPIGSNHAPIVSPATYKTFVLDSYAPIIEVLRKYGVQWIGFATYANARVLLKDVLDAGFNCLWATETESRAMDYRDIRKEFGHDLRLIGGIDLDVLLRDASAIRDEMMVKVPPLLVDGGFIPLADGRVRATVPFENYVFYRQLLEELACLS